MRHGFYFFSGISNSVPLTTPENVMRRAVAGIVKEEDKHTKSNEMEKQLIECIDESRQFSE